MYLRDVALCELQLLDLRGHMHRGHLKKRQITLVLILEIILPRAKTLLHKVHLSQNTDALLQYNAVEFAMAKRQPFWSGPNALCE